MVLMDDFYAHVVGSRPEVQSMQNTQKAPGSVVVHGHFSHPAT